MKPHHNNIGTVLMRLLLIMNFMFWPAFIHGQRGGLLFPDLMTNDSARAIRLLSQAEIQLEKDSFNLAYDLANEALQSAMRSEQTETEINILSLLADIYNLQEQPGEAIPYYLRIADILKAEGDTTSLPSVYAGIARNYMLESVFGKAGEHYFNALLYTPADHPEERVTYLEKTGISILKAGMADSAIFYFNQLDSILGKMERDNSHVLNYIVQAHNNAGRFEQALDFTGILFNRYRNKLDYRQMSALKNNMGYNLTLMNDFDSAAICYQEAIDYGRQAGLSKKELALFMTNAGICYQNMERSKQAKSLFNRAIRDYEEVGELSEKSRVENIMALIYYHERDLYNAGVFSRSSIESAKQAGDSERLSESYLTYSRILREGNDPIQALEYYENHLNIRDSLQLEARLREQALEQRKEQLEKSERELILKLKEEQVKELAYQQLELQLEKEEQERQLIEKEKDIGLLEQERLRDSLLIARQRYIAEQQERENRMLEQEQRITALRLQQDSIRQMEQEREIRLLEQEQELDRLELARQKTAKKALVWISILGLIITLLILGSLIWSRKKNTLLARQKAEIEEKNKDLEQKNEEISAQRDEIEAQRDLLSEQKGEIEQYNKEILKSLEYARKIQTSTLPDLESLNTLVSEHFLLFRPRDIVSGDFFWTASVENSTVITVADCTGHGVPGAFMSMLGMSLLKEIVLKEYITQPAVILRRLRKEVINALGQKGMPGEQRDGMDLALVTLFHDTGKLEYAGAYNSLYLARRKDQPEPGTEETTVVEPGQEGNGYILYEIHADKMPIAYFVKMDRFASRELDLVKGDNVYLFSDGYPDQFGGPRGKKFKYKPFKEMLLQNAHLPMEQQYQILSDTLDQWQGTYPQVDDICVIGLKI